jgi:DNA-binding IclR family transcriptional regulator
MDRAQKQKPPYAIASVDHALRLAAALQLEGVLTVADAADRLGVARSTAHRLLQMLVYRDFAVQDPSKAYRAGPVLELAAHSGSHAARLREAAMPELYRLVATLQESANLAVRVGTSTRFIASAESPQSLRVGTREGMVFPAHRTTAGLLLLAELSPEVLHELYPEPGPDAGDGLQRPPDLTKFARTLQLVRKQAFAVNQGASERGIVAVGVPVREPAGPVVAGLSVSLPSVRYERRRLPELVATLRQSAARIEQSLR